MASEVSLLDATSHLSARAEYEFNDDTKAKFKISTPHHYLLSLSTDITSRFRDAKLNDVKVGMDLECDEHVRSYPSTFNAQGIYNNLVALNLSLTTEKGANLLANTNLVAKLYQNIYGSAQISYDDKVKGVNRLRYGLHWRLEDF